MSINREHRLEHDLLGENMVPQEAYYGIQTQRAMRNFKITGVSISHYPDLIRALAMVKQAAIRANLELGLISENIADAVDKSCQEIVDGLHHDQFMVDLIQGGAGTSTNMNANEVISNRALELLGYEKGRYDIVHPNDHVNCSQSTNDVYPTAARLAIVNSLKPLIDSVAMLSQGLNVKAKEFSQVIKMGRTQLQDAVPMTLGQEFNAFATTLMEDVDRLDEVSSFLLEVNLGGTAVGTGINTHSKYANLAINYLSSIAGEMVVASECKVEATSDMGGFMSVSSVLKRLAVKLSKISNDLRLLSSGPRAGLGEINLPAMQPGSSIMPGKVNPVIPEAVSQAAYHVVSNDLAVTLAAEAGQLQLNAMEPLIIYKILDSIRTLRNAINMLDERCVRGITANKERCSELVHSSIAIITALNRQIGYENATRIAKKALLSNSSVIDLVLEEKLLDKQTLADLLHPDNMLAPKELVR